MTPIEFVLLVPGAQFEVSLFFHSVFLHRYGTHKQFTMSEKMERKFFIMTYIVQGSSFLNPRTYAIIHVEHHEHSDTAKDPHSPSNFSIWKWGLDFPVAIVKMMQATFKIYEEVRTGKHVLVELYKERKFPEWEHYEKFMSSSVSSILWTILYIFLYATLAPVWWVWLFLPVTVLSGPIQGAFVNWCGHMWGFRNFNLEDNSKNTPLLNILMLGEPNQNNHHKDPQNPNFARKWHEFDIIYPILLILNWMKIIKISK